MSLEKDFFTPYECANKLNVNIMSVYRWIKSGKMKAYRFGRVYRISKKALKNYIDKSRVID